MKLLNEQAGKHKAVPSIKISPKVGFFGQNSIKPASEPQTNKQAAIQKENKEQNAYRFLPSAEFVTDEAMEDTIVCENCGDTIIKMFYSDHLETCST